MRKGITNVFAEFYKDLYSKRNDERKTTNRTAKQDLKTLVTILRMTLKTVSKTDTSQTHQKRTDDCNRLSQKKWNQRQQGIKAEVIKGVDEDTITIVHDIFLQLDHQTKFHGFQLIGKSIDHSRLQDRWRDKSRELHVDLWSYTALNTPLSTMLYNRVLAVLIGASVPTRQD